MKLSTNKSLGWQIAVVGLVILAVCLIFNQPKPIVQQPKERVIERRIETKEANVDQLLNQVAVDRNVINSINNQLVRLKWQLNAFKKNGDTTQIIKLQDIIIHAQDTTIVQYEVMDSRKDSIIADLQDISKSKDTIIDIKDQKIKKKNRTILGLTILSILEAGAIIIK